MAKMSAKQLKVAGLILLLIPIALLLLFTIGETVSGDISGLGHLIQLAPLVILAIFAWKKPDLGGKIFVVIGVLLAITYLALVVPRFAGRLGSGMLLLFGTPIISGLLFIASARKGA